MREMDAPKSCAIALLIAFLSAILVESQISAAADVEEIQWPSLAKLWREYYSHPENGERTGSVETQLSAALLDVGNKANDAESYIQMYKDSERLAMEALQRDPENQEAHKILNEVKMKLTERTAQPESELHNRADETFSSRGDFEAGHDKHAKKSMDLSYEEALDLARSGQLNQKVLKALRKEHAKTERAGLYGIHSHRVNVKLNLGVTLLNLANDESDPDEYTPLYRECEEILQSVLQLDPGNSEALDNLSTVRRNMRTRKPPSNKGNTEASRNPPDSASKVKNIQKPVVISVIDDRDDMDDEPEDEEDYAMSYDEAVALAVANMITPKVVEAMRREHTSAIKHGRLSTADLLQLKLNFGATLLNHANNNVASPAEYTALYRESEAVLTSALDLPVPDSDPQTRKLLQENIETARRNLRRRTAADASKPSDTGSSAPSSFRAYSDSDASPNLKRQRAAAAASADLPRARSTQAGKSERNTAASESAPSAAGDAPWLWDYDDESAESEYWENDPSPRSQREPDWDSDNGPASTGKPKRTPPSAGDAQAHSGGLSYEEAVDSAKAGKVTAAVVAAMRREYHAAAAAAAGPAAADADEAERRLLNVMVNLGAALLDLGNQAATVDEYTRLYKESERVLLSAMGMPGAEAGDVADNLASVRKNLRVRLARDGHPGNMNSGDSDDGSDDSDGFGDPDDEGPAAQEWLSYNEAMELARRGGISEDVVDAVRREHRRVEADQGAAAGWKQQVAVKVNLGAALLDLANRVPQSEPARFAALYRESEAVLLSALRLDPGNRDVEDNLGAVRRTFRNRVAPSHASDGAGRSEYDEDDEDTDDSDFAPNYRGPRASSTRANQGKQSANGGRRHAERHAGQEEEDFDASPASREWRRPQEKLTKMRYQDALEQARAGKISAAVVEAFRQEHAAVEAAGDSDERRLLSVKVNLGAALLDLGNRATSPAEFVPLYRESEEVLRSALEVDPDHEDVRTNLASVRRSLSTRAGDGAESSESQAESACGASRKR